MEDVKQASILMNEHDKSRDRLSLVKEALQHGKTLHELAPLRYRKILKSCFWSILLQLFTWVFLAGILLKTVPVEYLQNKGLWAAWVGVLIFLLVWRLGYPFLYLITYYYNVDEKDLIIRKGVIEKSEIAMPFTKITDVYVDQDGWDAVLGLYDVHFSTPTVSSGEFAHIDGVDKKSAHIISALILDHINKVKEG